MSSNLKYDCIILGAGIAGLSAADHLLKKGLNCAVVDPATPGSGASGAPLMLMHPATGRRAKMPWKAKNCVESAFRLFERLRLESNDLFYEKGPILRPALTEEIAEDFSRSPEKYNWPDSGWVEWYPPKEFSKQYPFFKNNFGGLVVRKGATVDGFEFINILSVNLIEEGLKPYFNSDYRVDQHKNMWKITLRNGDILECENLVYASGNSVVDSPYWEFLPLNTIKGQTATCTFSKKLPIDSSVSSMGYLAYMQHSPNRVVVGSTYEHHYSHLEPDEEGKNKLLAKIEKTIPGLTDHITSIDQWAAIRVSSQDHKPVVGDHPDYRNLFIIGALGSKGLLMGHYLAKCLAERIVDKIIVPETVSTHRYFL